MTTAKRETLAEALAATEYVSERATPSLRNPDYPCLKDLHSLVERLCRGQEGDVFDYGCGGAPYSHFFTRARSYVRADIHAGPQVDRILRADGRTDEQDRSYDLVLSTQVLEHIRDPQSYLVEAHRILKPGGELIVTTHGMIQEHGCPYDFQRWTAEGLKVLVSSCGFEINETGKITTGPRAFVQLVHHGVYHLRAGKGSFFDSCLGIIRKGYYWVGVPLLNRFADLFPGSQLEPGSSPASLYTGVFVRAKKN